MRLWMVQLGLAVLLAGLGWPPVLVVLALGLDYLLWMYFHPYKACGRCSGSGLNWGSTRKASGRCKRCGGTRQVQRIGSKRVHRAVRSAIAYRGKDR